MTEPLYWQNVSGLLFHLVSHLYHGIHKNIFLDASRIDCGSPATERRYMRWLLITCPIIYYSAPPNPSLTHSQRAKQNLDAYMYLIQDTTRAQQNLDAYMYLILDTTRAQQNLDTFNFD